MLVSIRVSPLTSGWTIENIRRLFVEMRRWIPRTHATCSYVKGLKSVDWNMVAFAPFSAQDCEQKWGLLMKKVTPQSRATQQLLWSFVSLGSGISLISLCHWFHKKMETYLWDSPARSNYYITLFLQICHLDVHAPNLLLHQIPTGLTGLNFMESV